MPEVTQKTWDRVKRLETKRFRRPDVLPSQEGKGEKLQRRASVEPGWERDAHPPAGVGPRQLIYLHSSVDTDWPDLYLNMITMT